MAPHSTLNLREITVFIAVAQSASFSQAARRLHHSQPAVSRAIHNLEHQFGTKLFERQGRVIRLTPAGAALLPVARDLAGASQAEELARLPVFSGLRTDQLARLVPLLQWARFPAGTRVFAAGDPAHQLYIMTAGEVSIRYHPYDGGCIEVATVRPPAAFGWSAVLQRAYYTSSANCRTEVEALALHTDDLHQVMSADVVLGDRLLENFGQLAANRLEGLGRQLIQLLQSETGAPVQER